MLTCRFEGRSAKAGVNGGVKGGVDRATGGYPQNASAKPGKVPVAHTETWEAAALYRLMPRGLLP